LEQFETASFVVFETCIGAKVLHHACVSWICSTQTGKLACKITPIVFCFFYTIITF